MMISARNDQAYVILFLYLQKVPEGLGIDWKGTSTNVDEHVII